MEDRSTALLTLAWVATAAFLAGWCAREILAMDTVRRRSERRREVRAMINGEPIGPDLHDGIVDPDGAELRMAHVHDLDARREKAGES
jgi:hypothetical protein